MKQTEDFERCARQLGGLTDPNRLRIVDYLFGGPKSVSDLCSLLNEPFGKVSHHLKVLRNAECVQSVKRGREVIYRLYSDLSTAGNGSKSKTLDFGCCKFSLKGRGRHCCNP
jgi:DNA-binding transcriptional ArsR family regulator